jgi:hypothetical protein
MAYPIHEELRMRFIPHAVGIAALALAVPAIGAECYVIVDRGNDIVYQGLTSPVDLSDAGKAAREALRAHGQQLIVMNTDTCPPIDKARITGNGKPASVDEIVAGMRPAIPFGRGGSAASNRDNGISLPEIRVPVATDGPVSVGGPISGMGIR